MKRKVSTTIVVFALSISPCVYADAGWTDSVTVAELVATSKHYYTVRLPVRKNPSGCENKTWFYIDYDATGSDKMYKTILEAVKSGMQLRVYVTGKCNLNGYSEISSVSVSP